jgi:fibronectin type 3 domain-containing protein
VELGKRYSYTVTAIDRTGNESAPSLAAEVTAQERFK